MLIMPLLVHNAQLAAIIVLTLISVIIVQVDIIQFHQLPATMLVARKMWFVERDIMPITPQPVHNAQLAAIIVQDLAHAIAAKTYIPW